MNKYLPYNPIVTIWVHTNDRQSSVQDTGSVGNKCVCGIPVMRIKLVMLSMKSVPKSDQKALKKRNDAQEIVISN
jgi:hypothetical protein